MFHVEHSKPISPDNPGSNEGKTSMANTKTEKPETTTPTAKQRKARTPKVLTPLEAQVVASLSEQKLVTRALRGVAKAVSQLGTAQAKHVLTTALDALEDMPPVAEAEAAGS